MLLWRAYQPLADLSTLHTRFAMNGRVCCLGSASAPLLCLRYPFAAMVQVKQIGSLLSTPLALVSR